MLAHSLIDNSIAYTAITVAIAFAVYLVIQIYKMD